MKIMTRRNLLAGGATALGATMLGGSRQARAGGGGAKNLIIVAAAGGWDATYGVDPKPTSLPMIDAPDGTIESISGIPLLTDAARPSVSQFFRDFGPQTAVINGIQTSSISHTTGYLKIMTGTPSSESPDMGAIAAAEYGDDLAAPYLVLGTISFSGPFGASVTRTGTLNQVSTLLDPQNGFPLAGGETAGQRYIPGSIERGLIEGHVRDRAGDFMARRGSLGRNGRRVEDFLSGMDRASLLKDVGPIQAVDFTQSLAAQVDIAVEALDSGLSRAVQIEMSGFDTHVGNADQGPLHEALFAELHRLMTGLEDRGLLGDTVVAVVSELGRTPLLNAEAGKDHWPVASAMVMGAGVAGGQALGASDDSFGSMNVDLATGAVDSDGVPLRHSNLAAGILELVGVDPSAYLPNATPLSALRG